MIVMKHSVRSSLILVFLAAILVRIVYSLGAPAIFYNVDTEGYYNIGMNLFTQPSLRTLITPYRTPVYPIFLNTVMQMTGAGGAEYGSSEFLRGAQVVIIIQMLIGAIAFTSFYKVLSEYLTGRLRLFYVIFLLLDVLVIGWEHTLMTEGLAVSISIFITCTLLQLLRTPSNRRFIFLWLLFTLGFLLRPSFIVYPIATLPILGWFYRKQARVVLSVCIVLACAAIVPLTYARVNYGNHGYFGIQYVGDIDVLGRILEFHIPVESAKNNTYFYTTVMDNRSSENITNAFRFIEKYDFDIYSKPYRFVELQSFTRTVVGNNIPLYVGKALGTIPQILLEVCDFIRIAPSSPYALTFIVGFLQQAYGWAQYATLLVPLVWVPIGIMFLLKPTRWNTFMFLIGTIAMSQVILTSLVVYKDIGGQYGRVLSVIQPHLYLFLLVSSITILRAYRKH